MKPVRRIHRPGRKRSRKPHPAEGQAGLDGEMLDAITQSLFSLTLTLRAARQAGEANQASGETERLFDSAEEMAQRALSDMCALTFELRPEARKQVGLVSALETHIRSLQARSQLDVHMSVRGDRSLPPDLQEALYQVTRNALQELVRRGEATQAWVELDLEGENVYISIRDNSQDSAILDFRFRILD